MTNTIIKGRRAFVAALALFLAFALALLSGCGTAGASTAGKGTLTVGVRADIMGFGYLNKKTKKYYGMEIDLANEMASRMGYKDVKFVTVTPENRKEMLLDGKIDAIVACYSISDTRRKNFDFSPAYYSNSVKMIVQNSSLIENLDGLKGGVIGTMNGSNTAPMLNQKMAEIGFSDGKLLKGEEDGDDQTYDNYRLVQYPSYQELSDALEEGEVDGMAMDGAIAQTYMDEYRSILPDFSIDPQKYGVATRKGSELSAKVKTAVQDMLDDGTIEQYIDKWN